MAGTPIAHGIGSERRAWGLGRWVALIGVTVAVAVIVELAVSWPTGAEIPVSGHAASRAAKAASSAGKSGPPSRHVPAIRSWAVASPTK